MRIDGEKLRDRGSAPQAVMRHGNMKSYYLLSTSIKRSGHNVNAIGAGSVGHIGMVLRLVCRRKDKTEGLSSLNGNGEGLSRQTEKENVSQSRLDLTSLIEGGKTMKTINRNIERMFWLALATGLATYSLTITKQVGVLEGRSTAIEGICQAVDQGIMELR